jgi:predicted TIM-barrel fold metal-dependent hydrolase
MLDDAFVIDAVVHGYHFAPENAVDPAIGEIIVDQLYRGVHVGMSPRGRPEWTLSRHGFVHADDPELLAHALFAESATDACVYHGVPGYGLFRDGGSPLSVGRAMRDRWPGRVALYGPVSPWQPGVLEEVDRLVEEDGVVGLKLYPMDLVDGEIGTFRMDDPEVAFPIFERARQKGIRTVAIHKAIALGPVPIEPFRVTDVEGAAAAFPDLTIEVVHGGLAFTEETALQLWRFPNVAVNLEGASAFLANAPRRFAEVLGTFLSYGAEDRIVWATGVVANHPQPFLEAFARFEMPRDLVEDYGYPELTPEVKAKILGGNIARIAGLDVEAMRAQAAGDEWSERDGLAPPWSGGRAARDPTFRAAGPAEAPA